MNSSEIIEGLLRGDEQVIASIYDKTLHKVKQWIINNNGTYDDGMDIFQDALEAVIEKAYAQKLPDNLIFEAYLFSICKNKWYNKIKEKDRELQVRNSELERYKDMNVVQELEYFSSDDNNLKKMLSDTYYQLSHICQKLVSLVEAGEKPADIAEALNMSSANTVYRRKFACYESWRKHLLKHPYYKYWKHNG